MNAENGQLLYTPPDHDDRRPRQRILMEVANRSMCSGFLEDVWDEDGDTIQIQHAMKKRYEDEPIVSVEFGRGAPPDVVARMLLKCVRLLQGMRGPDIVDLGQGEDEYDFARPLPDGEVGFANVRAERRQLLQELGQLQNPDRHLQCK